MSIDSTQLARLSVERVLSGDNVTDSPYSANVWFSERWTVETNHGTETVDGSLVSSSAVDDIDTDSENGPAELLELFRDYIDGSAVDSVELVRCWSAQWTMPGFLDCGTVHTAETETDAIRELLEADGTETGPVTDWEADALRRLAEIVRTEATRALDNELDPRERWEATKTSETALSALLWNLPNTAAETDPANNLPETVRYSGDVNPIDHGGAWFTVDDWKPHGYASAVRCQSGDGFLWIESGSINKADETTAEALADVYNVDPDELTEAQRVELEIDHARGLWGMDVSEDFSGPHSERFALLDGSGWFLNSDGETVSENELSARLVQLVSAL